MAGVTAARIKCVCTVAWPDNQKLKPFMVRLFFDGCQQL